MASSWHELTDLVGKRSFHISEVKMKGSDIRINGEFELPPLASVTYEDQVFIAEFIRSHGNIKQMEQTFGVSYPTIKNRLNKIAEHFHFVEVRRPKEQKDILTQLEEGKISAKEALKRLERD